jgi:nucleoside-diphosphate-sugar epimerase
MSQLFCFGLGYTARVLACECLRLGWQVAGTARSQSGVDGLRQSGFDALLFDGQQASAEVTARLRTATHVLTSVPPDAEGDAVLRLYASDLATAPQLSWIGYLSTVGVYGNTQGDWVDEASPVSGDYDRTRWRIDAERQWQALATAASRRVQIFRLAGIYGPGRSALDSLRTGRAQRIVKPGQVFNRIHVADIAQALAAGMAGRGVHAIYNVADDEPAPPQDVITYAAELLQQPPPPEIDFADADLSPMARSFYEANRRVSNARMKADLGIRLAYPNYRDGLQAIVSAQR